MFNLKKEGDWVSDIIIRMSAWVVWFEILLFVLLAAFGRPVSWDTVFWVTTVTLVALPGALFTHKLANFLSERFAKKPVQKGLSSLVDTNNITVDKPLEEVIVDEDKNIKNDETNKVDNEIDGETKVTYDAVLVVEKDKNNNLFVANSNVKTLHEPKVFEICDDDNADNFDSDNEKVEIGDVEGIIKENGDDEIVSNDNEDKVVKFEFTEY